MAQETAHAGVDLRRVARRQRFILWCILLQLLATGLWLSNFAFIGGGANPVIMVAGVVLLWVLRICTVVGLVMMMSALRRNIVWRVLYAVLSLVPWLGLLLLVAINAHANRVLKHAGLKIGLMGVSDEMVRRQLTPNLCGKCGYDLTGNVSGICPECGTPMDSSAPLAAS